jgi:TRAP-type uncharacterized transport system substrate-binding protein
MIVLIILLIGLILANIGFGGFGVQAKWTTEGFADTRVTESININPFNTTFYQKKEQLYKIDPNSGRLHLPLIIHGIGPHIIKESETPLDSLNQYDLDFVIDTELNIVTENADSRKNLRLVCALYAPSLLLIAPNGSNIIDLGDIKYYTCKVVIAVNDTGSHQALTQILSAYDEQITKNINIIVVHPNAQLDGYGSAFTIYAGLGLAVQNPLIRELTDKVPSHLVSFHRINAGSYHITHLEKPFYTRYPYYNKKIIDINQLKRLYPQLSSVHNRDLYYPTIRTRYVLLCHDKVPDDKIQDILNRILILKAGRTRWDDTSAGERQIVTRLFEDTSVTDIGYTAIPLHKGSEKAFHGPSPRLAEKF